MGLTILRRLASLLEPEEREAVLGDLAETGESEMSAVTGVLGLVVRRQAALWLDWRPWLTLLGIAFLLSRLFISACWSMAVFVGVPAMAVGLSSPGKLAFGLAVLSCWSLVAGAVLRTVAPRTLFVQIALLLGFAIGAQALLPQLIHAIHGPSGSANAASAIPILLVAVCLRCGSLHRVPRSVLFLLIPTIVVDVFQRALWKWEISWQHLEPVHSYHIPLLVMVIAGNSPLAYIAIRIGAAFVHRVRRGGSLAGSAPR